MTHISSQLGWTPAQLFAGLFLLLGFYVGSLLLFAFCQWLDRLAVRGWGKVLQVIDEECEIKERQLKEIGN
jgi:hypothetical protein